MFRIGNRSASRFLVSRCQTHSRLQFEIGTLIVEPIWTKCIWFYFHEHDDFSTARTDRFWRPGRSRGTDWSGDGKNEFIDRIIRAAVAKLVEEKFQ